MSTYLSEDVRAGLEAARTAALESSRNLRLLAGTQLYPVLRIWDTGFAVSTEDAPRLRGFVDLFDGTKHLYQCLVIASKDHGTERHFEFKRRSDPDRAQPLDFEVPESAPLALITAD